MCFQTSISGSLPRSDRVSRPAAVLFTGLLAGLVSTVAFVSIHSFVIAPIWTRVGVHVLFPAAAGIALAWAYDAAASIRRRTSAGDGARFGLVVFASLIPPTGFSNSLRLAGLSANGWIGFLGTVMIGMASGAAAGVIFARTTSASRSFAVATFVLMLAMGGTVPVVNGVRAAWLFAGFLPICVLAGTTIALVGRYVNRT